MYWTVSTSLGQKLKFSFVCSLHLEMRSFGGGDWKMSVPNYLQDKLDVPEKMDLDIPDLPSGPLDVYRKKASFCWKDMVRFLDDEDTIAFKKRVFGVLKNDPSLPEYLAMIFLWSMLVKLPSSSVNSS
ncbi:hypothetical protein GJAV_G00165050 [Gymnothorax javanicus]|nr:hypothetical protein GJAV_G00165050 [Gymnothorax javanicus]